MADADEPSGADQVPPKLIFDGIEDSIPEFSNFMQASYDANIFRVVFCRYLPPVGMRTVDWDEYRHSIEREGYHLQVVSQLMIAPAVLKNMVDGLNQQIEAYEEYWGKIASDEIEAATEDDSDGS